MKTVRTTKVPLKDFAKILEGLPFLECEVMYSPGIYGC